MRLIFLAIIAIPTALAGASARPSSDPIAAPAHTSQSARAGVQTPNATGTAVKAFQERVKEWVAFHNKVEATVPQLTETSDPAKISARERALDRKSTRLNSSHL